MIHTPQHTRFALALLTCLLTLAAAPADASPTTEPFAIPQPGQAFTFPRDHGSHPDFRIEWWYVTGHLWDSASNRFGFQSTFFRTAGPRHTLPVPHRSPNFGIDHLFLSHAALLDLRAKTFRHRERLHREGWAAGANTTTLHVWNEGASLTLLPWNPAQPPTPDPDPNPAQPPSGSSPVSMAPRPTTLPTLRLIDSLHAEASWDLTLRPIKPLVTFGTNGVSRKGADPSAASHYLTFPRLQVEGRLTVAGESHSVRGLAWMDHEFGSSQLDEAQSGWDWISIQFHDGRELMAYRMRRKDGSTDPFSTLAWVAHDGTVTHVPPTAFELEPLKQWRSPRSDAEYPSGLRVKATDPATGQPTRFDVIPLIPDQELPGRIGNVPYWEGACRVLASSGEECGVAFIELTGYAGNLSGTLR